MTSEERLIEVAVAGPLRQTFTYRLPAEFGVLQPGQRLLVPFGKTGTIGYYLGKGEAKERIQVKRVAAVIDHGSLFSHELFTLCVWLADYYFANPADCFSAALPPHRSKNIRPMVVWGEGTLPGIPHWIAPFVKPGQPVKTDIIKKIKKESPHFWARLLEADLIRMQLPLAAEHHEERLVGYRVATGAEWADFFTKKKYQPEIFDGVKSKRELRESGWSDHAMRTAVVAGVLESVTEDPLPAFLSNFGRELDPARLLPTLEQQEVINTLLPELDKGFAVSLLHGVTGSGKTLVYCQVCQAVLDRGQSVLVLTPEIALAGTTLAYFKSFFPDKVTVLHSAMSNRERQVSWNGIRQGKYRIVIGPRSALFAPVNNVGMIIVDEEHDPSFKQDDPSPRFHGRDAAIMRGKFAKCPVLLGSATPSVESFFRARQGQYRLLQLTKRPGEMQLPSVQLVDMRKEQLRGDLPFFSFPLKKKVEEHLQADEQVILYLNRRGHSPMLKCSQCGFVPLCPNCHIKLTFHKSGKKLTCHYCGYLDTQYDTCRSCGATSFLYLGVGTQKVEEMVPRLFERGRTVRFDSDAILTRGKAREILHDFSTGKYNLLLGTQMVTKGLDFPGVTLVGVLAADFGMDMPDFRANERTFVHLTQVAGRSGRAERPGIVVIQTFCPDNDVIRFAAAQDYHSFYEQEIRSRQELQYPPFTRLINVILSGAQETNVTAAAQDYKADLIKRLKQKAVAATVIGPAPCPLSFLRRRYRRHLLIKTTAIQKVVRLLTEWERAQPRFGLPATMKCVIDVDPVDMM